MGHIIIQMTTLLLIVAWKTHQVQMLLVLGVDALGYLLTQNICRNI